MKIVLISACGAALVVGSDGIDAIGISTPLAILLGLALAIASCAGTAWAIIRYCRF